MDRKVRKHKMRTFGIGLLFATNVAESMESKLLRAQVSDGRAFIDSQATLSAYTASVINEKNRHNNEVDGLYHLNQQGITGEEQSEYMLENLRDIRGAGHGIFEHIKDLITGHHGNDHRYDGGYDYQVTQHVVEKSTGSLIEESSKTSSTSKSGTGTSKSNTSQSATSPAKSEVENRAAESAAEAAAAVEAVDEELKKSQNMGAMSSKAVPWKQLGAKAVFENDYGILGPAVPGNRTASGVDMEYCYAPLNANLFWQYDLDSKEHKYKRTNVATLERCQAICTESPLCQYFVYRPQPGASKSELKHIMTMDSLESGWEGGSDSSVESKIFFYDCLLFSDKAFTQKSRNTDTGKPHLIQAPGYVAGEPCGDFGIRWGEKPAGRAGITLLDESPFFNDHKMGSSAAQCIDNDPTTCCAADGIFNGRLIVKTKLPVAVFKVGIFNVIRKMSPDNCQSYMEGGSTKCATEITEPGFIAKGYKWEDNLNGVKIYVYNTHGSTNSNKLLNPVGICDSHGYYYYGSKPYQEIECRKIKLDSNGHIVVLSKNEKQLRGDDSDQPLDANGEPKKKFSSDPLVNETTIVSPDPFSHAVIGNVFVMVTEGVKDKSMQLKSEHSYQEDKKVNLDDRASSINAELDALFEQMDFNDEDGMHVANNGIFHRGFVEGGGHNKLGWADAFRKGVKISSDESDVVKSSDIPTEEGTDGDAITEEDSRKKASTSSDPFGGLHSSNNIGSYGLGITVNPDNSFQKAVIRAKNSVIMKSNSNTPIARYLAMREEASLPSLLLPKDTYPAKYDSSIRRAITLCDIEIIGQPLAFCSGECPNGSPVTGPYCKKANENKCEACHYGYIMNKRQSSCDWDGEILSPNIIDILINGFLIVSICLCVGYRIYKSIEEKKKWDEWEDWDEEDWYDWDYRYK